MDTSGRGEDWTGAQLAEGLASLEGVAPDPVEHVIARITLHADGRETQRYQVADEAVPMPQTALPRWLARHRLRGADRLALAMLIIRETLDAGGLIRECTLERRRGALDGPLYGEPARVEFTGPARMVRFYRVRRDGRLAEIAGTTEALLPRRVVAEHFAAEQNAIRAQFGPETRMVDAREPMLFESMVGLDSIVHVRLADGREIGCGIGWHGPVPFVLAADFPRFAVPLQLAPENEAAVQVLLAHDNLVRHETRLDVAGLTVVARRRGGETLFLLRADGGKATASPYEPRPAELASDDQVRWMRYAETYEHLVMLDAWQDGDSGDLLVITGDESGQIWRHHIDADGVETWRKPDETAAAGLLYREKLSPGTLAATEAAVSEPPALALNGDEEADAPEERPEQSLLAKAEAYVAALAALARGQEAATRGAPLADALPHIRALVRAAETLEADHAVIEARLLLAQVEKGRIRPGRLSSALSRMEMRLTDELAAIRVVSLTPAQWRHLVNRAPFDVVEDTFPEAAHDIEEAALCLAFRRPSAVAFHCTRIVEAGLAALGTSLKPALPAEERQWAHIMALLHATAPRDQAPLLAALEQVRRCWRGSRLAPAEKYTEAEAERLFHAVRAFMTAVADLLARRSA